MSVKSWERFVSSLLTIHQSVCVELEKTNIDDVTAKRIPICHVENTENRCNIVDPDVTCHSLLYIHSIHSNEFNNASNFMYYHCDSYFWIDSLIG